MKRAGGLVTAVLAGMYLLPREARSQETLELGSSISVGTRVRVLAPTSRVSPVRGMVMELDNESLLLRTEDATHLRLPRGAITQLEVSVGERRQTAKGLLLGAVIGGASFGVGACCTRIGSSSMSDQAKVVSLGLVVGATCGAAIGYFIKKDRWTLLPLEQVRIAYSPIRAHRLSLSITF